MFDFQFIRINDDNWIIYDRYEGMGVGILQYSEELKDYLLVEISDDWDFSGVELDVISKQITLLLQGKRA